MAWPRAAKGEGRAERPLDKATSIAAALPGPDRMASWERTRGAGVRPCLIAFGGNLGQAGQAPPDALRRALQRLAGRGVAPRRLSRLYWSESWPDGSEPDYLNGVVLAWTAHTPQETLRTLLAVEQSLGRRRSVRRGPRCADLDLIAYGRQVLPPKGQWRQVASRLRHPGKPKPLLVVPHPLLHRRRFVLEPIRDVAPRWRHPAWGDGVLRLLERLPEHGNLRLASTAVRPRPKRDDGQARMLVPRVPPNAAGAA